MQRTVDGTRGLIGVLALKVAGQATKEANDSKLAISWRWQEAMENSVRMIEKRRSADTMLNVLWTVNRNHVPKKTLELYINQPLNGKIH